jgi:tetratricopeptide (TPR) repeat protein
VVHRWLAAVEKAEGPEKVKELIARLRQEYSKLKDFIGVTPAAVWTGIRGLRDAGQYAEAVDALDRFADLLTKTEEVREMYRHLYDRWADHHVQAKAPAFAVDVYELAIRRFPKDKHVGNNLAVVLQQWALALQAEGREGEANAVLLRALIRFPDVPDVAEMARDHVPLLVQKLRNDAKYPEALAALDRHWDLLQELHGPKAEAERGQIGGDVYHVWAGGHQKKKEWEKALEVYEKGMRHLPKERDLRENAAGVYDAWARTFWDKGKKDWDGGIAIYDQGIKRFPDSSLLKGNKKYCEEMKKREGK